MKISGLLTTAVFSFSIAMAFDSSAIAQQPKRPVNDTNVEAAINKAVEYILSQQKEDGSWPPFDEGGGRNPQTDGPTAMCIYSLVASGIPAKDPKITKALEWLVKPENQAKLTYSTAFRCLAWYTVNKQLDNKYMKYLKADVELLIKSTENGSYNYVTNGKDKATGGDNSNSQYGLYGVWTGARAGLEIPKEYWEKCLKRWIACQHQDGGWNYYGTIEEDPSNENTLTLGSMTVAGIASLFVCIDWLFMDKFVKCQMSQEIASVKKGMDWMDKNFLTHKGKLVYYLYGVERVGLASGYKYFGTADWYKTGAQWLLELQGGDGTWGGYGGILPNTCYGLLFLIRGRLPVILNRLEYEGDWCNRPRALANFCRWAEKSFETEANWQIITLKSDVNEWHDSAILTITGSKEPKFTDEEVDKLRTFVNQGGTIFSITECNGSPFTKGIKNLYQKMFPKYELTPCGKDHLINTIVYKTQPQMKLYELSNGIRPLAIHSDFDLPLAWQQYQVATGKPSFETAANTVMYVTDKQFKYRGSRLWPAEPKAWPTKTVKVARLRFNGNYDPEPLAMQRLSRLIAAQYDLKVECIPAATASAPASASQPSSPITGITPAELTPDIKLAVMTGTGGFKLEPAHKDALKKWTSEGGILLLDATGSAAFTESAKDLVSEICGADSLLPLSLNSQIYQLKDMTIDKVKYRRAAKARIGAANREPRLLAVTKGDRPVVIVSQEDITGGLVDYASATCDGYEPDSAFCLMRNIVLYAASSSTGGPAPASAPAPAK